LSKAGALSAGAAGAAVAQRRYQAPAGADRRSGAEGARNRLEQRGTEQGRRNRSALSAQEAVQNFSPEQRSDLKSSIQERRGGLDENRYNDLRERWSNVDRNDLRNNLDERWNERSDFWQDRMEDRQDFVKDIGDGVLDSREDRWDDYWDNYHGTYHSHYWGHNYHDWYNYAYWNGHHTHYHGYYDPYYYGRYYYYYPPGSVVDQLPDESATPVAVVVDGTIYYYYEGDYFVLQYKGGEVQYMAVDAPLGALVWELPEHHEILEIDGETYYLTGAVFYKKTFKEGEVCYKVVKMPQAILDRLKKMNETESDEYIQAIDGSN
jgi:hypothetical protein